MTREILPAILPNNYEELSARLGDISRVARTAHIDACDGAFVPRVSWPYGETDPQRHFEAILKEEEGLPFWEKLDFEIHLMAIHPERLVEKWVLAGASRVIVQAEAVGDKVALSNAVGDLTELGIALKLETPLEAFTPFERSAHTLHLMSIARIGFQGEEFQESVFEKIRQARVQFPHVAISVDGGVSLENAEELFEAGAQRLVAGSSLFESEDVAGAFREFETMIK